LCIVERAKREMEHAMNGAQRSEAEWSVARGMCGKLTRSSGKGNENDGENDVVARDPARTLTEKPCSRTNANRETLLQDEP